MTQAVEKRIKRNTNEHQTFRAKHSGMLMGVICQPKLCLNYCRASEMPVNIHAQYAERTLLLHFESIWDDLTRQSSSTNSTITFHFLYLQWARRGSRQNNTLARLHRHRWTLNKSSKQCPYLLLMGRFTCSLLCSERRDEPGDSMGVSGDAADRVTSCYRQTYRKYHCALER